MPNGVSSAGVRSQNPSECPSVLALGYRNQHGLKGWGGRRDLISDQHEAQVTFGVDSRVHV